MSNLRTNVKVKFKVYSGRKLIKVRWFTIRHSARMDLFLLRPPINFIDNIFKTKDIKCDITVHYTKHKDDINQGIYDNHKECLHAFRCFTEQELIKEFWDGVLIPKRVLNSTASERLKRTGFTKRYNMAPSK